jgi:hypothetical protein
MANDPFTPGARNASLGTTRHLIDVLAEDLRPAAPIAIGRRLSAAVAGGAIISALIFGLTLGNRHLPLTAGMILALGIKLGFALSILVLALWTATRLSRPDIGGRAHLAWMATPPFVIGSLAFGQMLETPAGSLVEAVMGASALACPGWIVLGALAPMIGLLRVVRDQAPTRPCLTGAVIGAGSGAAGAAVYATHCIETAIPFITIWYGLGILTAAGIGAAAGSRLLRW